MAKLNLIGFSLRKFLAISSAIQKISSDCGCDAMVHYVEQLEIFLCESNLAQGLLDTETLRNFMHSGRSRVVLGRPDSIRH